MALSLKELPVENPDFEHWMNRLALLTRLDVSDVKQRFQIYWTLEPYN